MSSETAASDDRRLTGIRRTGEHVDRSLVLRRLTIVFSAPAALVLLGLCLARPAPRAEFVIATTEPRTLDPQRVSWLEEIQLSAALFEGLTRLHELTFAPEPGVAERWDISPDGRTWTFHLRPAARWSTGEPVTAEDFRWSWLRALDPRVQSQYANLLLVLEGAEAYYTSRANDDDADDVAAETVGIDVLDAATLRVRLARPCPYFLELTSFVTFAPLHRPTLERFAYRDGRVLRSTQHLWTRPGHLVGNGPFVLAEHSFKRRLLLVRNPCYWDAESIGVRSIEARVLDDANAKLIAYETGRVDLVTPVERAVAQVLRELQQAGRRPDFHSSDRFATYFYRVNCRRWPLDDANLRKALSLAIDRESLCTHVLRLGETPAYTYVPHQALRRLGRAGQTDPGAVYEPPEGLGAGLSTAGRQELARQYLRASGYAAHAAQRPLEILIPPDSEQRLIAQALQAVWEDVLGLRIELRIQEASVISSRIRHLDYDLARSMWFGDYLDPGTFLEMFLTASTQNRTGWSNAAYDQLVLGALNESDVQRRYALFRQAERILCVEELPILPVFFRRGNYLLNPEIQGVHDNVRDLLLIHRARRVPSGPPDPSRRFRNRRASPRARLERGAPARGRPGAAYTHRQRGDSHADRKHLRRGCPAQVSRAGSDRRRRCAGRASQPDLALLVHADVDRTADAGDLDRAHAV